MCVVCGCVGGGRVGVWVSLLIDYCVVVSLAQSSIFLYHPNNIGAKLLMCA